MTLYYLYFQSVNTYAFRLRMSIKSFPLLETIFYLNIEYMAEFLSPYDLIKGDLSTKFSMGRPYSSTVRAVDEKELRPKKFGHIILFRINFYYFYIH